MAEVTGVIEVEDSAGLGEKIALVVVSLMAIGTIFVFSAGVDVGKGINFEKFYESTNLRKVLFFPLAIGIMSAMARVDYRRLSMAKGLLRSPITYLFIFSVILLVIVLLPGIGSEINQARRWLRIPLGPATISFQPSEFAKWVVIFGLAGFCIKYGERLKSFWRGFVPACLVVGTVVVLVIIEDFGSAALIALLSFFVLLVGGADWKHLAAPLPFAAVGFVLAVITSPTRKIRILAFLNHDRWAGSANYQAAQSLIAIGSGGLFGKGLGMGVCKYGHLPEDTTDFIFAIISEELGFVGAASVIALFIVFLVLGFLVVMRCQDPFGKLLATSIVMAVGVQAALNIGVVTVVLPTKGLPLPFVSAGGTSMLLSAAAVGVLLNIASKAGQMSFGDDR
ncbi:MAG: cell division protein FtsW [Sedimentisphaerales bacterium]|nr:cell division protein FtsW [Sedimentisphaerales bacterium]